MFESRAQSRHRGRRGLLLGIICVALLGFFATVQVAHFHDSVGASHSDCSLCVIVHAGIVPHAPVVVPAPVEHKTRVEILPTETPWESFVFSFYTRPPPAETASL